MEWEHEAILWLGALTTRGLPSRVILANVMPPSEAVIEDEAEENNSKPLMSRI